MGRRLRHAIDGTESLSFKMREAYPRLTKLAPGKPIMLAEFACDLHNPRVNAAKVGEVRSRRSVLRAVARGHRLLLVERGVAER